MPDELIKRGRFLIQEIDDEEVKLIPFKKNSFRKIKHLFSSNNVHQNLEHKEITNECSKDFYFVEIKDHLSMQLIDLDEIWEHFQANHLFTKKLKSKDESISSTINKLSNSEKTDGYSTVSTDNTKYLISLEQQYEINKLEKRICDEVSQKSSSSHFSKKEFDNNNILELAKSFFTLEASYKSKCHCMV